MFALMDWQKCCPLIFCQLKFSAQVQTRIQCFVFYTSRATVSFLIVMGRVGSMKTDSFCLVFQKEHVDLRASRLPLTASFSKLSFTTRLSSGYRPHYLVLSVNPQPSGAQAPGKKGNAFPSSD